MLQKRPSKNFVLEAEMFYPCGMSHASNGNGSGNGHHAIMPSRRPVPPGPSQSLETGIIFETADGVKLCGTMVRITRFAIFFELHNPSSLPRVSEVIGNFEVVLQSKLVYLGGATIRNLVSTGLTVTCEAGLSEECWVHENLVPVSAQNGDVVKAFKGFLEEWQKSYKVSSEFKLVIADMQTFLTDARLWLEKAEVGIRHLSEEEQLERQCEMAQELQPTLVPAILNLFERFEEVSNRIQSDQVAAHHAFGKRLVQPILMASPFVHRTLTKPLGYAGDYEMVNMMFRDPFEGKSLFAKMVNLYALNLPPIIAHRNRIDYLGQKLEKESLRKIAQNRDIRIFNLGCGPAIEVQRFLEEDELSHHAHFTLVDFNDETLTRTTNILNKIKLVRHRNTTIEPVKKSVNMLIKSAARAGTPPQERLYDLVYCAGLFDYLTDNVCQQLLEIFYSMLAPGGLLVATNVDEHPARNQMECFLEWHLIHRDNEKMRAIAPAMADPTNVSIKRDATGVNIFLEVRKPDSAR